MTKSTLRGAAASPSQAGREAVETLSTKQPKVSPSDIQKLNEGNRETVKRLVAKKVKEAPSAVKATCDKIDDMIGYGVPAQGVPSFEHLLLGDAIEKDARARAARSGRTMRAEAWHAEARKLIDSLWQRRPAFEGNAGGSSRLICPGLKKHCNAIGIKPPSARTLADFIRGMK